MQNKNQKLLKRIEEVRLELYRLVGTGGLNNESNIKKSQQLDRLIIKYQKEKK